MPANPPDVYDARRRYVRERVHASGLTKAEVARRLDYTTESGAVYVRRVLSGLDVSAVLLDKIEGVLDSATAEPARS